MGDGKIQNIGVKEDILEKARGEIHYDCRPYDWQMFEILFSFCKDHPGEFTKWKKNKLEQIKKKWEKRKK